MSLRSLTAANAILLVLAMGAPGQTLDADLWATDGEVLAIEQTDDTIYIGGTFTRVGPATGGGVPLDATTLALIPGFPKVAGTVYTAIPDGAGGWYIGGDFSHVGGLPRTNLARVLSDLSVSPWASSAGGPVYALALRGTTLYVGGDFIVLTGEFRFYLGAVDTNLGLTQAWNPSANNIVYALAVHTYSCGVSCSDTRVYAGGAFTTIGGQPRNFIASLDINAGAATTWNPSANGPVKTLGPVGASTAGVRIYAGGEFTSIGGQTRNRIAQLNLSAVATTWNPNANGPVSTLSALGATIYACGAFTSIGGLTRNRIAALDGTGAATLWDPNLDDTALTLLVNGSTVYAGGTFHSAGGQPSAGLVALDATTGSVLSTGPSPGGPVHALALGGSVLYTGGAFSLVGGVARANIAALDVKSGTATSWNPGTTGTVHTLALAPWDGTLYAGGAFTSIGGQLRNRIAALDPETGSVSPWNPDANGIVRTIACEPSNQRVWAGGDFTRCGFLSPTHLVALDATTGFGVVPGPSFVNGPVYAIALGGSAVYVGGSFTNFGAALRRNLLLTFPNGGLGVWDPSPDQPVRALATFGSLLYAAGEFTQMSGQPRSRVASFSNTTLTAWDPGANGIVRALAPNSNGSSVYAGGDFGVIGGSARSRLAELDNATGLATSWNPTASGTVVALEQRGTTVYAGGQFISMAGAPAKGFAGLGVAPACALAAFSSPTGTFPRAIATSDFDGDGIQDLVVCNSVSESVTLERGNGSGGLGNGTFSIQQTLPFGSRPKHAVAADFNADGQQDLAVSLGGPNGPVEVYLNSGGTLVSSVSFPALGRTDGLAAADVTQDGILDLVVCLVDSAGFASRGGLEVLRGGGLGGVWDGTFTSVLKIPTSSFATGTANRVFVHDFNQDGVADIACTATSSLVIHRFSAPLVRVCTERRSASQPYAVTIGDYNGDGKTDIATGAADSLEIHLNQAMAPQCSSGFWFSTNGFKAPMPSVPREIASIDYDQDGILDIVSTHESPGSVQWFKGNGTAGVGDGTFQAPVPLASWDASGIAVGDFVTDGSPDLAIGQPQCDKLFVIENPNMPNASVELTLVVPNGGEIWDQGATVAPLQWPSARSANGVPDSGQQDARLDTCSPALSQGGEFMSSGSLPEIASLQQISWIKGAGIPAVDVQISRDDGVTWQTIAAHQPGTSTVWVVTPPGTPYARIRVRDSAVPSRVDGSDAVFTIPASAATDVGPGESAPVLAGFSLRDRNPVRDTVRFRMDVPKPTEARVQVFDVRGRVVRTLVGAPVGAGQHEITWDTRNDIGVRVARGVYFVRAQFGTFSAERKVVVVN